MNMKIKLVKLELNVKLVKERSKLILSETKILMAKKSLTLRCGIPKTQLVINYY